VYCQGRAVALRPKAFRVLRHLVERPGVLVTKDELLDLVWPGVHVGDAVLKGCVREIRRALGDDPSAPRFIATVHGRGYRFIAPVAGLADRDAARQSTARNLTVGRAQEIARLLAALERARGGDQQVVFVAGEPGIGKSTLVEAFLDRVAGDAGVRVGRGECVQQHGAGEAYLPVLDALARLCRGRDGAHVVSVLRRCAPAWLAQMPALVTPAELDALQRHALGAAAQRMLHDMAQAVDTLTERSPLVLVLEDLHWGDRSTLDLVAWLARRPSRARLMILATYRTGDAAGGDRPLGVLRSELLMHGRCVELVLEGLAASDVAEYLDLRFPGHRFPRELSAVIHERTDGHPLFMAGVLDDLVASGAVVPTANGWALHAAPADVGRAVPDNVRRMIESQLSHLTAGERSLLEVASVFGLEFPSAAVATAAGENPLGIEQRCEELVRRHLFLSALPPQELPAGTVTARYRFLHAVHRNVLYDQVPAARRAQLHRRAGEALEALHGGAPAEIAAELALHFEQGRDWMRAAAASLQAAQNAARRFACHEAIGLARRGLDAVTRLQESEARTRLELRLLMTLGPALITTRTFAAPEVQQVYARARRLCQQAGEMPDIFPILWGLVRFYLVGSPVTTARTLAEEMLRLATRTADPDVLIHAHDSLGAASVDHGDFVVAHEQFEACRRLYDPERHRSHVFQYVQDPGVACRVRGAVALWCLGYPDRAFEQAADARALARRIAHPFSEAFALGFSAMVHELARDWGRARELADAAVAFASKNGFPTFALLGGLVRAGVRAVEEPGEAAANAVRDVTDAARDAGVLLFHVYGHGLQARGWARAGFPDRALATIREGLRWAEETGERFYEAEMHRLEGDIRRQIGGKDAVSEAEACYRRALAVARRQQARSWELRSALSLAAAHASRKGTERARQIVRKVLSSFAEGFETPDLRDARAVLDGVAGTG
jgi:DNA-binding winged helix-turn-helix (wHTH) protein/predicted ATPase